MQSVTKNKFYFIDLIILVLFSSVYIFILFEFCTVLPLPSDPLEYLEVAVWKTTWGHSIYLDRIMFFVGLTFISSLFELPYTGGVYYIFLVNVGILLLALGYSYKREGIIGASFIAILLIGSNMMTRYSNYIYPNQTVAFYSLLAFVIFKGKERRFFNPVLLSGVVSSFALFSKCTAIATPLFFIIFLLYSKRSKEIFVFIKGLVLGSVVVLLLAWLVLDFASLQYVFSSLFKNLTHNIAPRGKDVNLSSYLQIFVSHEHLPAFISLFIILSAYKMNRIKEPLLMAVSHIVILYLVFSFTSIARLIPNYLYTTYIFSVLGLALYLSSIYNSYDLSPTPKKIFHNNMKKALIALLSLFLLIGGFWIGLTNGNTVQGIFKPGYEVTMSRPLRSFYTLSPILIVCLLSLIEFNKSKKLVIAFLLLLSIWMPAYGGAMGLQGMFRYKEANSFFYGNAPLFNLVPVDKFNVYIKQWNRQKVIFPPSRVINIYRVFFNNKYQKKFDPDYTSRNKNKELIENSIRYIKNEKELLKINSAFILTDAPWDIRKLYTKVKVVKEIKYGNRIFYLVNIHGKY